MGHVIGSAGTDLEVVPDFARPIDQVMAIVAVLGKRRAITGPEDRLAFVLDEGQFAREDEDEFI